jgi:UDP-glucose 4-epimerase
MAKSRVVLVTGVTDFWGRRVAEELAGDGDYHVIGMAPDPLGEPLPGLDFIQTDIRNPLLYELLRSEQVDTVCHMAFQHATRPNEAAFDHNVMGTMKVLGACAEADVTKIILRSSTMVYGAGPQQPGFIEEDTGLTNDRSYGYLRDMVEIEAFVNGFRRQHPEIALTVLRFANVIGPHVDSPLTRFLRSPISPVLLGFDPLLQMIHEEDAVMALVHSIRGGRPGIFNLAADPAMPLSKILGIVGKLPIPVLHPVAYWGVNFLGGTGKRLPSYAPMDLDYLRYRWIADTTKMRGELEYTPAYTAEEAVREFAGHRKRRKYLPDVITNAFDEERLRRIIQQRREMRSKPNTDDMRETIKEDNHGE